MKISILTIFPEQFDSFLKGPVLSRVARKDIASIEIVDIRAFAGGSYRHIDESPYGGGAGMILRCGPVYKAHRSIATPDSHTILLAPGGHTYSQKDARRLSTLDHVILLCGHYEGFDARIEDLADEILSIGDYVLTGGELPAMSITDSVVRLLDGALRTESTVEESFEKDLIEYPQYTKPRDFEGRTVPEVLLSGDHEKIRRWRRKESLRRTKERRPDLLQRFKPNKEDELLMEELEGENNEPME